MDTDASSASSFVLSTVTRGETWSWRKCELIQARTTGSILTRSLRSAVEPCSNSYPSSFVFKDHVVPAVFAPSAHIFYGERVMDLDDDIPKVSFTLDPLLRASSEGAHADPFLNPRFERCAICSGRATRTPQSSCRTRPKIRRTGRWARASDTKWTSGIDVPCLVPHQRTCAWSAPMVCLEPSGG